MASHAAGHPALVNALYLRIVRLVLPKVITGLIPIVVDEPVEVEVNRPFLLLVRYTETGVIYFSHA